MPVWEHNFPTLVLGMIDSVAFSSRIGELITLAQTVQNALVALALARQERDDLAGRLRVAVLRLPQVIEGSVDASAELGDNLRVLSRMKPTSPTTIVARGRALSPVWTAANAWRAAQSPPLSAIEAAGFTQASFQVALDGMGGLEQAVADAEGEERGTLRRAARALEVLCIRFLKSAWGSAEPGSAEEAALRRIPTLTRSSLPKTLRLGTLSQGGEAGRQVLVAWPRPRPLAEGESAVLEYRRVDMDAHWSEVPYAPEGNALGPFTTGVTVEVRTRVTNASGSRRGRPKAWTLGAPLA